MALDRQLRTLVKDRVDRTLVARRDGAARARMFASVVLTFLAVGWWAALGGATSGRLYNPGHVTAAHARLEHDCNACHGGKAAGESDAARFRRPVTDAACLACHDGAVHHPNQLVAADVAGVGRSKLTLAINDPHRDASGTMRAADCASCHVEHRGERLMAGRADAHCTVCHADLKRASSADEVATANSVTAFDLAHHPPFGRKLLATVPAAADASADAPPQAMRAFDPTKLKFNHLKHLTEVEALSGDRSCVTCHELASPSAGGAPGTALAAQAYAAPVSYDRHCASCHKIDVPGSKATQAESPITPVLTDLVAPHRPMAEVRAFLADRVGRAVDAPLESFAIEDEDHPAAKFTKRQLWLWANLKLYAENAGAKPGEDADPSGATASSLADAMTANLAATNCQKCHELSDAAGLKIGEPFAAETLPTGIPKGVPRRWFTGSRFDHRAHRDMSCVECHTAFSADNLKRAAAMPEAAVARRAVTETSFVNSPNLTWSTLPAGGGATRSCADCHHADTSRQRGATADCAACHNFHDRSRERPILANPTTVPAAHVP